MSTTDKFSFSPLVAVTAFAGSFLLASNPASAGTIHWKEDPASPGCYALAFNETNEWFATSDGYAFKKGICHGQRIQYKVVVAPDAEHFTASGANFCSYHVVSSQEITVSCRPNGAR